MTPPILSRTNVIRLLSILLAAVLIWLALRDVELEAFFESLRTAHYGWILPLIGVTLASHWIRAYRWQALVTSIPNNPPDHIQISSLFQSVMVGYMVNYALPRVGEIARCTHLSTQQKLSFPAVLGTVVVERILDTITLAIGLTVTVFLLWKRIQVIFGQLSFPQLPWMWITVGILIFLFTIYFVLHGQATKPFGARLRNLVDGFLGGLRTIRRTPERWRLMWTTIVMWLLYGVMAYVPLIMFDLHSIVSLSYWDGLAIMFIGVLGILVPTPGGAGSFHFITILTLTAVYGISQTGAAAYAVFVHGAQLVLYLIVGVLVLLNSTIRSKSNDS